jgi:ligand-binding SRPBCC domain-containing protein
VTEVVVQIDVRATPEQCFDAARSMDFHTWSMGRLGTGERIVGGRSAGLLEMGEEVEFEARHLGSTRRLRARMTAFDRPRMFTDMQVKGPFRSLVHTHTFERTSPGITRVTDRIQVAVDWWLGGLAAERLAVGPHLRRLLTGHQANLQRTVESGVLR